MSERRCPICRGDSSYEQVPRKDEFLHTCSRCGRFHVTGLKPAQNPGIAEQLQRHIGEKTSAGITPKLDALAIDEALNTR